MKPKIYIFSIFKWKSDLLHREHMLALAFSRLGYEVCFIERCHKLSFRPTFRQEGKIEVLTVFALPYFKGLSLAVFKLNDWLLRRQILEHIPDNKAALLMLSSPLWTNVAQSVKPKKGKIIYDMSDNHLAFATNKRWFENLKSYESTLLNIADETFISSPNLSGKILKNKRYKVFGNGVDLEKFSEAKPILKDKYEGQIVGFVGGVYERVNLDIIEACALELPEVHFVVVGPTDRQAALKKMESLKNFHYLGAKPWQEIQNYFASFDIGIIPFVSEVEYPWLKTVDSVKIYQYAYFGYPIVTTQFGQIESMNEIVKVAKDKSEFVKFIKDATLQKEDSMIRRKRKELAKEHDWTKIANEMSVEIEKLSQDV
ncbi:MAG: glycosyltransferase [Patescibacteria group bacterium]